MAPKTKFAQLLTYHRARKPMSLTNLRDYLTSIGYPVSIEMLRKYEEGDVRPSPKFVYYVSVCLGLRDISAQDLLNAQVEDIKQEILSDFTEAMKENTDKELNPQNENEAPSLPTYQNTISSNITALHKLTGREKQVLELVSRGLSNQEISYSLSISMSATKKHITSIYKKLGVTSRVQAVTIAQTTRPR